MKFDPHPARIKGYRANTDKMVGVTVIPRKAYCPDCEKSRTEASGEYRDGRFFCIEHKRAA